MTYGLNLYAVKVEKSSATYYVVAKDFQCAASAAQLKLMPHWGTETPKILSVKLIAPDYDCLNLTLDDSTR